MRNAIGLLCFVILFSCSKDYSFICTPSTFPDAYEYPVKPGTEEWVQLESRDARAQACMIPQETLETISTGGLFESLLSYPFIIDYEAWEKMQAGFEKLKSENTGFTELYSREDLFQIIYDWYSPMCLECRDWIYRPDNAPVVIELEIIEMFIFQNEFLDSLNQDRVNEIFKLIFNKLQSRIDHECLESEKWVSAAILGKIMFRSEFTPFVNKCLNNDYLKFFIEYIPVFRPVDLSPTEIIEDYANDFYSSIVK